MVVFVVLFLLLFAGVPRGGAFVLDVAPDGSGSYPDLEHALAAAGPGDSIRLADGVFAGAGNRNLILGGEITLFSASGDAERCAIDVEGNGRAFLIYTFPGSRICIEGITMRGGDPGDLPEDLLPGYGGALAVKRLAPGGLFSVERCVLEGNEAEAGGGAFLWGGEGVFRGCTFRNNLATDGGGAYCFLCDAGSGARFEECVFYGNDYPLEAVGGYGAGVFFSRSVGRVESCTFAQNRAWYGAGILASDEADIEVEASLLAFGARGNGLAVFGADVAITRCDIFGNAGGDWVGPIAGLLGVDCNFSEDPLFCAMGENDFSLRSDSPCLPENNDGCGRVGALPLGCEAPVGISAGEAAFQGGPRFWRCGPDPFLRETELAFLAPAPAEVRLTIHDVCGRLVAVLLDERVRAGEHSVSWDGVEDSGESAPSGVYFARLTIGGDVVARTIKRIR
ncbi:MAG: right-handed parallel beta-helix repeat-containing protein [Candidatus Eisenbacteria bacterium]|nr:right-handed parallel beta-helix repeat-containing protein [Candidatus Eisenbacteria bacterium]